MPVHTQAQAGDRDPLEEASELHDLAVSLRVQAQYAEAMASSRQRSPSLNARLAWTTPMSPIS